jgi:hypothetical protein
MSRALTALWFNFVAASPAPHPVNTPLQCLHHTQSPHPYSACTTPSHHTTAVPAPHPVNTPLQCLHHTQSPHHYSACTTPSHHPPTMPAPHPVTTPLQYLHHTQSPHHCSACTTPSHLQCSYITCNCDYIVCPLMVCMSDALALGFLSCVRTFDHPENTPGCRRRANWLRPKRHHRFCGVVLFACFGLVNEQVRRVQKEQRWYQV